MEAGGTAVGGGAVRIRGGGPAAMPAGSRAAQVPRQPLAAAPRPRAAGGGARRCAGGGARLLAEIAGAAARLVELLPQCRLGGAEVEALGDPQVDQAGPSR